MKERSVEPSLRVSPNPSVQGISCRPARAGASQLPGARLPESLIFRDPGLVFKTMTALRPCGLPTAAHGAAPLVSKVVLQERVQGAHAALQHVRLVEDRQNYIDASHS